MPSQNRTRARADKKAARELAAMVGSGKGNSSPAWAMTATEAKKADGTVMVAGDLSAIGGLRRLPISKNAHKRLCEVFSVLPGDVIGEIVPRDFWLDLIGRAEQIGRQISLPEFDQIFGESFTIEERKLFGGRGTLPRSSRPELRLVNGGAAPASLRCGFQECEARVDSRADAFLVMNRGGLPVSVAYCSDHRKVLSGQRQGLTFLTLTEAEARIRAKANKGLEQERARAILSDLFVFEE